MRAQPAFELGDGIQQWATIVQDGETHDRLKKAVTMKIERFLIPFGSPHVNVPRAWWGARAEGAVGRTCGEPNGIELVAVGF